MRKFLIAAAIPAALMIAAVVSCLFETPADDAGPNPVAASDSGVENASSSQPEPAYGEAEAETAFPS